MTAWAKETAFRGQNPGGNLDELREFNGDLRCCSRTGGPPSLLTTKLNYY